ncbi:hypothetical protein J7T55_006561 [Diaporthe amygdali]|uniref:uncharacterized protein n=1 Tax=Phomopsis amygdali TaxID=1214568 RepID=UPI0022FF3DCD|nr:uncharacterized protein J7T55_006561 [Diaporthe amygdali]KAJ0125216.1 hypothetical protein J7T55_006561 [Diaporthe amygdali]
MKLSPWSTHQRLPRQLPGNVSPDVIAQLDFTDKTTLVPVIWAIVLLEAVVITVVVVARLIVRRVVIGRLFMDDALIVTASLFTLVFGGIILAATQFGLGQHVWNLNFATILPTVKHCILFMFIGNSLSACAVAFTKLSIISSYLRVFPHQSLRITMYFTMAITIGLMLASIPVTVFQCDPCYDFVDFLYASTAISTATDLILCTVPIRYLWSLKIPKKQKIIVSFLFFIGGMACVASIVRLAFLSQLRKPVDVLYNLVTSVLLTITECTIGVVCVSLPSLRPIFAKCLPGLFNSSGHTTVKSSVARREAYAMGVLPSKSTAERVGVNEMDETNSHSGFESSPPFEMPWTDTYFLHASHKRASLSSSDYGTGIAM